MANKRNIPSGATRGTVFREVARLRLGDAAALLDQQRYQGAIYLAGYALECLLKHAITRKLQGVHLPAKFETHNLDELLLGAGLSAALQSASSIHAIYSEFAELWSVELRYRSKSITPKEASRLYEQVEAIYDWINDNVR
jgi:hypothetical protein